MTTSSLLALAETDFVRLTTFRRTGEPVGTAVWVVRDGDRLAVYTQSTTGKIKRLRHTSRVTLEPCSRSGAVTAGAVSVTGKGTISTDPADLARVRTLLGKKYGLQFRVFGLIEKVASLRRRKTEGGRVIIWITDPDGAI